MSGPRSLTLRTPFKRLDGSLCTALALRPHLLVGDILSARRSAGADETAQTFALVAAVSGLDAVEVASMDIVDAEKVIEHINEIRKGDDEGKASSTP